MQLPLVWIACISTVASSARMSGTCLELRPVELHVLARREVAVAAVVLARDAREHAQLLGRQQAVRNRDAQHRRVLLDVQAVAQAQGPEVVVGQLPGEEAPRLVAELRDALLHEPLVDRVVAIHGADCRPRYGKEKYGLDMS